jgi:hypothetical protein
MLLVLGVFLLTLPKFKSLSSGRLQPPLKNYAIFWVRLGSTVKFLLFIWTPDHQRAFELLKKALITASVLALPNFTQQFCIYIDACQYGIGVMLMQRGHPLAFLSRALGSKNQGILTYKKEYLAIILAVSHWRSYLQLAEFVIYTDHSSLTQLNKQRLHTIWQQKVYSKLAGLQYCIVYKNGIENTVADALSRQPKSVASYLSDISLHTNLVAGSHSRRWG